MEAATGLFDTLSRERGRRTTQSNKFKDMIKRLVGDVALSAAFISYGGPFDAEFLPPLFSMYFNDGAIG